VNVCVLTHTHKQKTHEHTHTHTHTHTHIAALVQSVYRLACGWTVLVSDAHLRPATNFFSWKFPFDSFGFIKFWRPLGHARAVTVG
jgi:hypothetical protein